MPLTSDKYDKILMHSLVGALEGGSNYWYYIPMKKITKKPKVIEKLAFPKTSVEKEICKNASRLDDELCVLKTPIEYKKENLPKLKELGFHPIYDTVANGGKIKICDAYEVAERFGLVSMENVYDKIEEDPNIRKELCRNIGLNDLRRSLNTILKKQPEQWCRITQNPTKADAFDDDTILQIAVFKKQIYG